MTCREKERQPIPDTSDPTKIMPEPDAFLVVIEFDMLAYKRRTNSRAVKKTLSIPEWLNEAATAMDLNFSQVLQEALMAKMFPAPDLRREAAYSFVNPCASAGDGNLLTSDKRQKN